ncbi:MAG: family 2 glycosyl transferase [Ponticaulis sp.]|nr:family 2 glycosyl transferase [Ponticaulis sp.]
MAFADRVSIIVPTFKRPDGLAMAMNSLKAQVDGWHDIELIIADNDPAGSACGFVERLTPEMPFPTQYVHAPVPGVANARNAAVEAASGRYLAFLDDDETASEGWLKAMMVVMTGENCCAVFSRIEADFEMTTPERGFFEQFFGRDIPGLEEGVIDHYYGCGSSLVDRAYMDLPDPVFSTAMNETGGEDDVLFDYLHKRGGKMGWTRKAFAREHVPPERLTLAYVRKRSFAFGQGPTRMYADLGPFNPVGIVRSMSIGAAQYGVFSTLALIAKLVRRSAYPGLLSRAYMGAGKVLWQKRFRPGFYGSAAKQA